MVGGLLLGGLQFVGFDVLGKTGDGEIVFGLLDLQVALFHQQPQAVHFRFGNALGKTLDGIDRSGQFGLGDLDRLLAEADVDVVFGMGLGDQQLDFHAVDGDAGLGIVDLSEQESLVDGLAFAHVERARARPLRGPARRPARPT